MTPAQCRKVKGMGQPPILLSQESMGVKLLTEAPVNSGRNYDGPKVAKFLVG